MSEFSPTAFTDILGSVKNSLDDFFRIPLKEEAEEIIETMTELNKTEETRVAVSDEQAKLLKILENDSDYVNDHHIEIVGGGYKAIPLLEQFRNESENSEQIEKYKKYVQNLKGFDELDDLFLEKLNTKFCEYKSSSDYISRTVKRLLSEFNKKNSDKDVYKYDLNEPTRVLILKHFIRQFDWFNGLRVFDVKDIKAVVKEKYNDNYELIDDGIFSYCFNQTPSWHRRKVTEGFLNTFAKIQGIIRHKAPFIHMTPSVLELIKKIIVEDKLTEGSALKEANVLADCFKEFHYNVEADWFKEPAEIGVTADLCDVLCRVVKPEFLTAKAKKGTAKTLADCFKNSRIPARTDCFKAFDEIEMTPTLCNDFYKILRKETNEDDLRSEAAKDGTATTLAECFAAYDPDMQITSINSIIMYFYRKIYAELDDLVKNCTVKKSTFNDSTKKGGDLYEKNRTVLNFHNYSLMQIVDDLANAKFSNKGKTREYLYVFAIAFDMTSSGYTEYSYAAASGTHELKNKEDPRKITDIQKNLFYDYYADNIVNNISKISGMDSKSSKGSIIDGYGINRKNFAEVAFLWSLNQNGTPLEKLKMAYDVISHCKSKGSEKGKIEAEAEKKKEPALTQKYADVLDGFISLSQSGIKELLTENYSCKSNQANVNILNEARKAKKICENIIEQNIKKHNESIISLLFDENVLNGQLASIRFTFEPHLFPWIKQDSLIERNEMLDFYKEQYYLNQNRCNDCPKKNGGNYPDCSAYDSTCRQNYLKFIEKKDEREEEDYEEKIFNWLAGTDVNLQNTFNRSFYSLSHICGESNKELKAFLERVEERIAKTWKIIKKEGGVKPSRATLLSLCYIDYILLNWHQRILGNYVMVHNFADFYEDFCNGKIFIYNENSDLDKSGELKEVRFEGADTLLKEAGYQTVSSKNVFDVCLIFMAYRDNYKQFFEYPGDKVIKNYKKAMQKIKSRKGD